jgi:hypothetical protein
MNTVCAHKVDVVVPDPEAEELEPLSTPLLAGPTDGYCGACSSPPPC